MCNEWSYTLKYIGFFLQTETHNQHKLLSCRCSWSCHLFQIGSGKHLKKNNLLCVTRINGLSSHCLESVSWTTLNVRQRHAECREINLYFSSPLWTFFYTLYNVCHVNGRLCCNILKPVLTVPTGGEKELCEQQRQIWLCKQKSKPTLY